MKIIRFWFQKTLKVLAQPDEALQACADENPQETLIYLAILSLWLGIFTALTNLFGFPYNLLNSGTNPQIFAYQDIAPAHEKAKGVSSWVWMAPLVWVLMMLFVHVIGAFYHLIFKLLRGKGGYWQTVRFFVYPVTPVLLFRSLPYLIGTVIAFWTAAYYPLALHRLHRFSWGLAILFVGILMGVQIMRIFLTGEWYGVPIK